MTMHSPLLKIIRKRQWTSVVQYISSFPEDAKLVLKYRFSCGTEISTHPIHVACMYQPPFQIIAMLIGADPESLERRDGRGWLPLHNAVRYAASYQIVSFLISAAPRTGYVKVEGRLPLHLACLYCGRMGLSVIRHLVFINPEALFITDERDLLPSDLIFENKCSAEVQMEMFSILKRAEDAHLKLENNSILYFSDDSIAGCGGNISTSIRENPSSSCGDFGMATGKLRTKKCVVCMERDVSRVLIPCGHASLCSECSQPRGLEKMHRRCPECRSNIHQVVTIFGRILLEE